MADNKDWNDTIDELEKATGWAKTIDSARLSWADEVEDSIRDSSSSSAAAATDYTSDSGSEESFHTCAQSQSAVSSFANEDIADAYARPVDFPADHEILENDDDNDDDDDRGEAAAYGATGGWRHHNTDPPCTWETYGIQSLYLQARDAFFSDGLNRAYLRHRFTPLRGAGQQQTTGTIYHHRHHHRHQMGLMQMLWNCRWEDQCGCHDVATYRLGHSEQARFAQRRANCEEDWHDWKGRLPASFELRPYVQDGMRSVDDAVAVAVDDDDDDDDGKGKGKKKAGGGVPALVVTSPEGDTMYPHDLMDWPDTLPPPPEEHGFIRGRLRPSGFYEVAYEDEDAPDF